MRAGGVVQTRKTRHESRANQHDELEKEEEDFHLLLQWLFPPCMSFLSFHYETQKQSRSKKEGRERERTALSALANANFLFPARLQWDTPRLLLFRQSTTLSQLCYYYRVSLSLSYFLTLISILTLFSLSRKLFRDKKKERASYTTYSATLFENREVHAKEEEEEGGYAHNAAKKEDNA